MEHLQLTPQFAGTIFVKIDYQGDVARLYTKRQTTNRQLLQWHSLVHRHGPDSDRPAEQISAAKQPIAVLPPQASLAFLSPRRSVSPGDRHSSPSRVRGCSESER